MNVRPKVVIVAATKQNHRTTRTKSGREDRPVPCLRYRRKAHPSLPGRVRTPSEKSPQNFFSSSGRIESGILRWIVVCEVARSRGCFRQIEIRAIARNPIPMTRCHSPDPQWRNGLCTVMRHRLAKKTVVLENRELRVNACSLFSLIPRFLSGSNVDD